MMVRLDISGGDTMFFLVRLDFFFIALMLSLNRTEGVNGSLNFLSMEQTGLEVNVTCG